MIRARRHPLGLAASPTEKPLVLGGLGLIGALVITMGLMLNQAGYDAVVGGITVLLILLLGLPALRRVESVVGPDMFKILWGGLVTKMVFSIIRYIFIFTVYDGLGDAAEYDRVGWQFAQRVRGGEFFPKLSNLEGAEDSTRRLTKLTGYVYSVVGHSQYAGFFIFSLFAFAGVLLVARGIQIAMPEVDYRRLYAILLFFPSLLFWPAALGKDAVMILMLGFSVIGAGMLLAPKVRPLGLLPFAAGLGGMLMIRPHVGLMSVMALAASVGLAVIARSKAERTSTKARFVRALLLIVMVIGSIVAASSVTRLFSEKAGEATSMEGAMKDTLRLTQIGGSKFQPVLVTSPASVPPAFVSVFFRPFPWEVRNAQTVIAALEGLALLVALAASWQRLRSIGKLAFRRPIVLFAITYLVMFTVAFSNIGNFGILARQRTQALPLMVFLVALPKRRIDDYGEDDEASDAPDPAGAADPAFRIGIATSSA